MGHESNPRLFYEWPKRPLENPFDRQLRGECPEEGRHHRDPRVSAPARRGTFWITDQCDTLFSCHTTPDESSYFGVVFRGEVHVSDFTSSITEPTEPFYTSLALFQMALDKWLPCFFPNNQTQT